MVFGISPGIALIVGAAVVMVLEGLQPDLLDRLQGRTAG